MNMKILYELYFGLDYNNPAFQLLKVIVLLLSAALLIYILYSIFSKILYRKKNLHSDFRLPITMLWTLVIFMLIFCIYFALIIYFYGFNNINWSDYRLYLGFYKPKSILHLEITFLSVILFYYSRLRSFKKSIKNK